MDRKSIAIIAVVFVVVVVGVCVAMEMDDSKNEGKEIKSDGYKLSLNLSLSDGLKCFIGDKEYFNGDTIVLYNDATVIFEASSIGTISCSGYWADPYGGSGGMTYSEEDVTKIEYDVAFTAYFGDMSGSLQATYKAGE